MTQASAVPVFRYRAFISYSHQDKSWAGWLHKALETYAIPKRLVGQTTTASVTPNPSIHLAGDTACSNRSLPS